MTDTNTPHSGGGVPQDCGKRMRVITAWRKYSEQESMGLVWVCVCCRWWCVVSWSAVQCLAQHQWCCVGCVGGDVLVV